MNNALKLYGQILLGLQIFCVVTFAQIIIPDNPFSITPQAPTTQDDVVLELYIGEHHNSCVPKFETSHSIESLICAGFCEADYLISIDYKELPDNSLPACFPVITPYGASFNLGKLAKGTYSVYSRDSTGNINSTFIFTVRDNGIPPGRSTISGMVTENTGMLPVFIPIAGATVYLSSNTLLDSTTTDANGTFTFSSQLNGAYNVGVIAKGYIPTDKLIFLGSDTTVNIQLNRSGVINPILEKGNKGSNFSFQLSNNNGLSFKVPSDQLASIQGYTTNGIKVNSLHWSGKAKAESVLFSNIPSGVYFFAIQLSDIRVLKKITIP